MYCVFAVLGLVICLIVCWFLMIFVLGFGLIMGVWFITLRCLFVICLFYLVIVFEDLRVVVIADGVLVTAICYVYFCLGFE